MLRNLSPVPGIVLLLLLIWVLVPSSDYPAQALLLSDIAAERLAGYRAALNDSRASAWGDFGPPDAPSTEAKFLNLTGFREIDGFSWDNLQWFKDRSLQLSRTAIPPMQGQQLWDTAEGDPLWSDIAGSVFGTWVRKPVSSSRTPQSYNLSHAVPTMQWLGDQNDWARNITGRNGRLQMHIESNRTVMDYEQGPVSEGPVGGGMVRNIRGTVVIEDTRGSGLNWEMRLWGAHWPRQGVVLMTTTSEKFDGLFGLPHLAPAPDFFRSSQRLLGQTIEATIQRKEDNIFADQNMPWNSDVDNPLYTATPSPHCEYILYAQVYPPSTQKLDLASAMPNSGRLAESLEAIEKELEMPLGAPVGKVPSLQMSTLIYSPDCGFVLESQGPPDVSPSEAQHLVGERVEVHLYQVKLWLLAFAVVVFMQVKLLRDQIRESSTPSTIGRVSYGSMSAMVIVDGMTFLAAATWVSSATATFLPTLVLMFSSFLAMTIGGSFLSKMHEVQLPEAQVRQPQRSRGQSSAASTTPAPVESSGAIPDSSGPLLPVPVTATRAVAATSMPVVVPFDQDIDAEIAENMNESRSGAGEEVPSAPLTFQAIVGRYLLLSLCLSFLAISSTTWYPRLRSVFLNACGLAYMSLWLPQIIRNTNRNCRRALRWQFVIGQSILRLLPIGYFWVKTDNFLHARTDPYAFLIMCAWVWLQLIALGAQDVVGPRFGVPASWTPDAWDYHPILCEDNLESGGLPIGLLAEDQASRRGSVVDETTKNGGAIRVVDCAICREVLEIPVVRNGEEASTVAGAFARRLYMVTPCRHVFHTPCLEGWMRFRLQCPNCREELPPL